MTTRRDHSKLFMSWALCVVYVVVILGVMRQQPLSIPTDAEIFARRKRAFRAALAVRELTQRAWAAQHGINPSTLTNVLSGRTPSARVVGWIYAEIEGARKIAPARIAEVL